MGSLMGDGVTEEVFDFFCRGGRQVVSDFGERKLIIDCWLFMFAEVGMALLGLAVWRKK